MSVLTCGVSQLHAEASLGRFGLSPVQPLLWSDLGPEPQPQPRTSAHVCARVGDVPKRLETLKTQLVAQPYALPLCTTGPPEWVWQEAKAIAEMKFMFQVCATTKSSHIHHAGATYVQPGRRAMCTTARAH